MSSTSDKTHLQLVRLTNPSIDQKKQLFALYMGCYGSLSGEIMGENEFYNMLDNQKYEGSLINLNNQEITQCFITRNTENGIRISYVFGKVGGQFSNERIDLLLNLISNQHYIDSSGPLARVIVRKNPSLLRLSLTDNYYYGRQGNHGKKITSGTNKSAFPLSHGGQDFIKFIFDYKSIKYKINNSTFQNRLSYVSHLTELLKSIQKNNRVPQLYKLVLINKVARKMLEIDCKNKLAYAALKQVCQQENSSGKYQKQVEQFIEKDLLTSTQFTDRYAQALSAKASQLEKKLSSCFFKAKQAINDQDIDKPNCNLTCRTREF